MTCKDCVHYEVCETTYPDLELPFVNLEKCRLFKDKSKFIELPCRVGDKVFDIKMGKIVEKSIVSISFLLSKSVNYLCLHGINYRDAATTIEAQDIGKTVFFTKEEAEKALEGINHD